MKFCAVAFFFQYSHFYLIFIIFIIVVIKIITTDAIKETVVHICIVDLIMTCIFAFFFITWKNLFC